MVSKKPRRIVAKPTANPAAEKWITQGGVDPEVKVPEPVPEPVAETLDPSPPLPTLKAEANLPATAEATPKAKTQASTQTKARTKTKPQPTPTDKAYPHRISFDMEKAQYKRLKLAAVHEERAMNEILREAIEHWMKQNNY